MSEQTVTQSTGVQTTKVVINPKVTRALVKLGYKIIDVKPNNNIRNATVHVFAIEGDFMKDMDKIINDRASSRVK